jgi:putative ABC transport system ATP-binding protein
LHRAHLIQPKILSGNEPTGALNSKAADEIMELLADIHRRGTTILLVTHDAKVAARTERVLFMLDGHIAGEYLAGAYNEDRADLSEDRLTAWLAEMKF